MPPSSRDEKGITCFELNVEIPIGFQGALCGGFNARIIKVTDGAVVG
jgi:hypothetical protein